MSRNERVQLEVKDGTGMSAYVSYPDGVGPHPGILVFQEALGVNRQLRGVADRYAAQGFLAIAPDLFHRFKPGYESEQLIREEIMPLISQLTVDGMVADVTATYQWLASQKHVIPGKIAAVGFCLGGRAAYLANSEVPLAASISYYGGGIAPALLDRATRLHGAQLFFWAGKDPSISLEQHRAVIDAVRAANKPFVSIEFSEATHGFFNEQLPERHHPHAAKESWAMSVEFLRNSLGR